MSREAAVLLARKLKALADHPGTPGPEAENARKKLATIQEQWEIQEAELEAPQVPVAGGIPMDPAWAAWSERVQQIINDETLDFDKLREVSREIPDQDLQRKAKAVVGLAEVFVTLFGKR